MLANETHKQTATSFFFDVLGGASAVSARRRRLGGGAGSAAVSADVDIDIDVSYQWLKVFLDDDDELARIGEEYARGRMLTGEIKAKLIDVLTDLVVSYQRRRAMVTDDMVYAYMAVRNM